MLANVHTKLKLTKAHVIQDAFPMVRDIDVKINKALEELHQARSDIFVQYPDAMPPRNATSQRAVQRATDVFQAFISAGVLINSQRDGLVNLQQSLPGMDRDALMSVMANPLLKPDTKSLQRFIATLPPFINIFGSFGGQQAQFNNARDVAVSTTGQVYVCDAVNNRVQVFTPDGAFLRLWNVTPNQAGLPAAVSVAPWGDVYLVQYNTGHVSRFQPNGNLLRMWSFDKCIGPIDVDTSDDAEVFVLNSKVRVFSREGDFLRLWDVSPDAQSLCIAPNNHVYVITPTVCHVYDKYGNDVAAWGGLVGAKKVTVTNTQVYVVGTTGVHVFEMCGIHKGVLGHSKSPTAVAVHAKRAYICESSCVEIVDL
jgi:DNA-binding beta-propeller fold protein YncE